jgi:hypothetical protein
MVSGVCSEPGLCTVELVCRRDRTTFAPPVRREYDPSDESLAEYTEVYRQANDHRWALREFNVDGERFETELDVPETAFGPCHIRVFVEGRASYAMGAADVFVDRSTDP